MGQVQQRCHGAELRRRPQLHGPGELVGPDVRDAFVGQDPAAAPRNHSPSFFADEGVLPLGVRTLANLAVDWLTANPAKAGR